MLIFFTKSFFKMWNFFSLSFKDILEITTYFSFNFLTFWRRALKVWQTTIILVFLLWIKAIDNSLVFFLLHEPKQVLIEFYKSLFDTSFPWIFRAILNSKDNFINNLHYKLSIVFLLENKLRLALTSLIYFLLKRKVVFDPDIIGEYKVIFLVINTVDLIDILTHPLGSTSRRCHWIVIR